MRSAAGAPSEVQPDAPRWWERPADEVTRTAVAAALCAQHQAYQSHERAAGRTFVETTEDDAVKVVALYLSDYFHTKVAMNFRTPDMWSKLAWREWAARDLDMTNTAYRYASMISTVVKRYVADGRFVDHINNHWKSVEEITTDEAALRRTDAFMLDNDIATAFRSSDAVTDYLRRLP
eukprot:2533058-Pyramimonas_sp.AAC.1